MTGKKVSLESCLELPAKACGVGHAIQSSPKEIRLRSRDGHLNGDFLLSPIHPNFLQIKGLDPYQSVSQLLHVAPARPYFGGVRLWLICPGLAEKHCRKRPVSALFLPDHSSSFACRQCHQLNYRSSQVHDTRVDALIKDPAKVHDLITQLAAGANPRAAGLLIKYFEKIGVPPREIESLRRFVPAR